MRHHGRHSPHDPAPGGAPGELIGHAHRYDLLCAIFFGGRRRRVFTRLAELSGAGRGDRILDVGCGTGYFTRVMAAAVGPDGTAHGVDPSRAVIDRARGVTRAGNCTFSEGIAQALGAADGSYDVVVSSLMIHHLPDELRQPAIGEMFRVLRPGGRLLIAEFRPPTSRIGRRLIRPITSHAMAANPIHLLDAMVRGACFDEVRSGDLHPWIRHVRAVKPTGGS